MTKGFLVAAAMAGGLLFTTLAPQPAAAVAIVKADMAKADVVTLVKGGGRGGFSGGGRGGFSGSHSRGGFSIGRSRGSFSAGRSRGSFSAGRSRGSFRGSGRSRSFGVYGGGGGKSFRRGHRGHAGRRHRGRYRAYYLPYVPYYYDDYGYGYADDCAWLHRKALRTDSSYWWRRYDACVNGY
jgi:hypothetical protein